MSEFNLNDRLKNRITKRKANIIKVQRLPNGLDYYTIEYEDIQEQELHVESDLRVSWYRIPKGDGKQKEVKTETKPKPDLKEVKAKIT